MPWGLKAQRQWGKPPVRRDSSPGLDGLWRGRERSCMRLPWTSTGNPSEGNGAALYDMHLCKEHEVPFPSHPQLHAKGPLLEVGGATVACSDCISYTQVSRCADALRKGLIGAGCFVPLLCSYSLKAIILTSG